MWTGQTLHYARAEPITARHAARLVQTLAGAIHYAHEQGIVHRDLKPSNILIDPDNPHAAHLGPVAQDFRAAFGLGVDDTSIATVDADGVALAAIQGLNQKLQEKETEIQDLKERLASLEQLIQKLATPK